MIRKTLTLSINIILVISLAIMCFLVLGNVVLRYVFNSGITWAEELSRYLFILITFLGAISALKTNEHLKVDLFVNKFSKKGKWILGIIVNVVILGCALLLLNGSWTLVLISADTVAPATGIPMSYIYGIGLISSIGMTVIVVYNLFRQLFKGKIIKD